MTEMIIDSFAGGGGASLGIELGLGRGPNLCVNHDRAAVAMHGINHPQCRHLCEDVFAADLVAAVAGRPVGLYWASPDCKHFSKAKGRVPVSKKIRGLAWSVVKAAAKLSPRGIVLENVEEFQDWGPLVKVTLGDGRQVLVPDPFRKGKTFRNFVTRLRNLGYVVEWRQLRACDYGAPTIRRRLFLIARRDGAPIVWPKPTHAAPKVAASLGLQPWRTAAECMDWSLPCPSIFLTSEEAKRWDVRRPLVPATHRRLAKGVKRYVMDAEEPFYVSLTHQGGDRLEEVTQPFKTITGAHRGEKALADVQLATFLTEHANGSGQRNFSAGEPMRTQCSEVKGGHFAGVAVHVASQFGTGIGHGAASPLGSVMAEGGGGKRQLVASFLAQHNGGMVGHEADKPLSTIVGRGTQQNLVACGLVKYYGTDQDPRLGEPLGTVTTKDRFGLSQMQLAIPPLTPELAECARRVAAFLRENGVDVPGEFATTKSGLVIWDIGMRMLTARELYRAQGFPEDYVIDRAWFGEGKDRKLKLLSKTEQVRMCGNSVSPPVAAAIVAANFPELSVRSRLEAAAA